VAQLARAHLGQMAPSSASIRTRCTSHWMLCASTAWVSKLGEWARRSVANEMDCGMALPEMLRRREIERAWREGLTPDPLLTVSEWSDRHRMLSSKASAEPGAGAPAARRT
jgi:hypothetical protein